jgi:hypothetical protein
MQIMLVGDNDIFREAFKQELCGRCSSAIINGGGKRRGGCVKDQSKLRNLPDAVQNG